MIVDADIGQCLVEADFAAGDVVPVEHGEDALAHGGEIAQFDDIPVLEEDPAAGDDDKPRRRQRLHVLDDGGQAFVDQPACRGAQILSHSAPGKTAPGDLAESGPFRAEQEGANSDNVETMSAMSVVRFFISLPP